MTSWSSFCCLKKLFLKPVSKFSELQNISTFRFVPFLTVDATTGNQTFSHDRCSTFPGLNYNEAYDTFLNSPRTNNVEVRVEITLKVMERARVTCYWCNTSYQRQFACVCTYFFRHFGRSVSRAVWLCSGEGERFKLSILPSFYFHEHLQHLISFIYTNFRFQRVLRFAIEDAWIFRLLRDAAFSWRPGKL